MHGTEMKGPADRELAAYEKKHIRENGAKRRVVEMAHKLRRARETARRKLKEVIGALHARHDTRARKVEFRPGQLVYRKQMVKGKKFDPKWVGPYKVIQKITGLVYRIQMGKREANLHVELLKLCRASREELRKAEAAPTQNERASAPPRERARNGSRRRNVGKL
jgi:hypothetical protein